MSFLFCVVICEVKGFHPYLEDCVFHSIQFHPPRSPQVWLNSPAAHPIGYFFYFLLQLVLVMSMI